jgi:flagellar hook assembly protein FlgD
MSNTITALNASTPPATTQPATSANGSQILTQADFLKIMVAQFTQQDPLSSSDGSGGDSSGTSDYVNQLMSMTNLTTLQTMSGQQAQQLVETLPGSTVQVDNNGAMSSGVVQSARVDATTLGVYFTVGGTEYPSSDLYSVQQTAAQTAAAAAAAAPSTASTGTP